jgi:TonB family protein
MKRRGSFFLFTVASYAVLFVIAGVVSIYAYDARMEDQHLEVVIMTPVNFPAAPTASSRQTPTNSIQSGRNFAERRIAMTTVDRPEIQPERISTTPNTNPPIPAGTLTFITGRNREAEVGGPGSGRNGSGGTNASTATTTIEIATPPPAPEEKPKPPVISKGPITSEALVLPKPIYPAMAKQMHLQGRVSVQVLIDETGKVISARAIDGHPIFRQVSQDAAYQARFSPTRLGDQAVKVSGVITYNFVLQ